jgi:hypothetical protein
MGTLPWLQIKPPPRPAKLFMALQVLLAIMKLTVLIARAVSA